LGIAASIAAALAVSVLMTGWSASAAPQLIEGITGLVAVVLMLVVGAWLHRKSAVKDWNQWLKAQMGSAQNRPWALGLLAFVAVLREGAETVVFFWGMAGALPAADLVAGIAGGLVVLVVLGVVMIGFSKRLPLGVFFPLATALIGFLAVKVLGQSLGSLQSSGWVSQTPLGFAGPVDWLGFSPSWETAGAQLVLAVVLVVATLRSGHGQKVPKQKA
jgi:high-affinity iron transporter